MVRSSRFRRPVVSPLLLVGALAALAACSDDGAAPAPASSVPGGTNANGTTTGGTTTGGTTSGTNNGTATSTTGGACGSATPNLYPFGCQFAWGGENPAGDDVASRSHLGFVSYWVDSSISAEGSFSNCYACNWLRDRVAPTTLTPVFYAYIIGFLGHANGICDGNVEGCPNGKLTTKGAQLVRDHRQQIVDAYAWYAKQVAAVWPSRPLVWLLEGDYQQYTEGGTGGQENPLTYAEVGALAADITCAIKGNMPNAVVAINHTTWNGDSETNDFWGAMKVANYDLVWTTGVGGNSGFLESGGNASYYNAATATYQYLHDLTGRTILVDTSTGASAAPNTWSTIPAADLNARIASGVIAANISGSAPPDAPTLSSLTPQLSALPGCVQ